MSSTGPASTIYAIGVVVWSLERVSVRSRKPAYATAGDRRDTHERGAAVKKLVRAEPANLVLYVPGLHLLIVSESLPSPPLLVLLISR